MEKKFFEVVMRDSGCGITEFEEILEVFCTNHTQKMVQTPSFSSNKDTVCTAVEKELAAYYRTGKPCFLHLCSASCMEKRDQGGVNAPRERAPNVLGWTFKEMRVH